MKAAEHRDAGVMVGSCHALPARSAFLSLFPSLFLSLFLSLSAFPESLTPLRSLTASLPFCTARFYYVSHFIMHA